MALFAIRFVIVPTGNFVQPWPSAFGDIHDWSAFFSFHFNGPCLSGTKMVTLMIHELNLNDSFNLLGWDKMILTYHQANP